MLWRYESLFCVILTLRLLHPCFNWCMDAYPGVSNQNGWGRNSPIHLSCGVIFCLDFSQMEAVPAVAPNSALRMGPSWWIFNLNIFNPCFGCYLSENEPRFWFSILFFISGCRFSFRRGAFQDLRHPPWGCHRPWVACPYPSSKIGNLFCIVIGLAGGTNDGSKKKEK